MLRLAYQGSEMIVDRALHNPAIRRLVYQLYSHHPESAIHSRRAASIAVDMLLQNTFSCPVGAVYFEWLAAAGLVHDVGKTDVPVYILDKPGELTAEERKIMQGHVDHTRRRTQGLPAPIRKVALPHHDEFSIHPYPRNGSKDYEGPEKRHTTPRMQELSQMMTVAEKFDALASQRAYKEPLSGSKIEDTLRAEFRGNPVFIEQVMQRLAA